ncbi:hypothetical protein F909_03901 [Acinetobacter sp. ANC 3929]|uniref:hypothetical protein n=1 Tax=Acinetobacter sp. ANC 3929 TaxID=1217707 RepID=UPI0002CFEC12|nr:hypothetical protein [Acinetobacter sp. ANC 3929]ENW78215.1 hypothetical protein F909_03901 [Acinetobacter sp. ANC 3929]
MSTILSLSLLPLIIAIATLIMVLLKIVSKKKAINYFTWMMFIGSASLYFKLFGDTNHKELADIWFVSAISYMLVFGKEDWMDI